MRWWQWLGGFIVGTIAVSALAIQGNGVWNLSEPAAIVNGFPVTKGELLKRLMADFGEDTLKQLITLKLLEQEAQKEGITVPDEEIKKRFEELKTQREMIAKNIGRAHLSDLVLSDEAKKLVLLEKLVSKQVKVTDEELRQFYSRHFIRYNRPEMVTLREIVVMTPIEAQQIFRQLQQTPAKRLAQEFERFEKGKSVIPGGAGTFSYEELPKEMRIPLQRAKSGEILPPIRVELIGQVTYRIVWVQKKTPAENNPFEKVRSVVRYDYVLERMAVLAPELIERLWKQAKIKYTVSFEDGTEQ